MLAKLYLWLAVIIFAASSPITRKVTEIGARSLIDGRNPISFCNVLFVGNLCAFFTLAGILYYTKDKTISKLRHLSLSQKRSILVISILSGALAPALIFSALSNTSANNVILISRLEPPLVLGLSAWFLKEQIDRRVVLGATIAFIGVSCTVFLGSTSGGLVLGKGEIQVAVGAIILAIATVLSKTQLEQVPVKLFTLLRSLIGAILFFFIALFMYGWEHFIDIFAPILWIWMAIYSAIIVVGGQLCWFSGLQQNSAADISIATSFSPVAGVIASFLLLQEVPTLAQWIGGSIILFGILIGLGKPMSDREAVVGGLKGM